MKPDRVKPDMKFDVIVVLAGGITEQGELPQSVRQRVRTAQKMYRHKIAPLIIMSGRWSANWDLLSPLQTEAALMVEQARRLGIPAKDLLVEEHSQNTQENAFYTFKLFLQPRQWKRIVVITSDFHVRRTQQIFRHLLGPQYQVQVIGTHVEVGIWKQLRWQGKEFLLSGAQWFLQYCIHRR